MSAVVKKEKVDVDIDVEVYLSHIVEVAELHAIYDPTSLYKIMKTLEGINQLTVLIFGIEG